MNHEDARDQLSAYLDGELDAAARDALDAALAEDEELRAELDALRRTVALVQSLPQRPAPAGLAGRVVAAIETRPAPSHGWVRRWGPVVLAAAACLVIGLLATLESGRRDVPPAARNVPAQGKKPKESVPREGEPLERTSVAEEAEVDMAEGAADRMALAASKAKKAAPTPTRTPGAPSPAGDSKMFAPDAAASGVLRQSTATLASQGRAGREASLEGQALLDDIRRVSKARARVEYKRQDAGGTRNGPALRLTLQYDRLEPCLGQVRAVLEQQQATYVVQPVGSGQFTIEAALPEEAVRAIVARLRLRGDERRRLANEEGLKLEAQAERVQERTAPTEQAKPTAAGPRGLVHLILHFEPRETAAGAAPKP